MLLKFTHYEKWGKVSLITYADLKSLIEKKYVCKKIPKTTKISENILCVYSMSTIRTFDDIESCHDG